jgi:superoxide dismutase, Cu-Zn family
MKTIIIAAAFLGVFATMAQAQEVTKAMATLEPRSGSQVKGALVFTKTSDGVQVVGDIENLKPGKHGFHIHEKGDCSAPDAVSAGAHFNPTHAHHGGPDTVDHHAGDFGNITADASGKAHVDWKGKWIALSGDNSVIGKSIVVHEKEDDLKTDPSGNSGARIACGVIEAAK